MSPPGGAPAPLHPLEALARHARDRPRAPALVHGGLVVHDHAGLAAAVGGLAARLSAHLRQSGLSLTGTPRVALHLPRGPDWVVALLATWAAGASALPLDPALPRARRLELLARAAPAALIGRPLGSPRVPRRGPRPAPPPGPRAAALHPRGRPGPLPPGRPDPEAEAWLIFSSGSTGAPKGVRVPHRAYPAVLADQLAALGLGPDDRCLWLLSPQFDASLSDVGVALVAGAALHTEPDGPRGGLAGDPARLTEVLRARNITYVDLPPGLLDHLDPAALPALRAVLCGGEPLPPGGAARWAAARRLIGVYGPTEATICASLWRARPGAVDRPWIGEPVGGARLRVVDGELWIGGPGLALGYLDDPALSAARFPTVDGGDGPPARWHRTGDAVVEDAAGRLIFAGRIDRQVKIDGRLTCPEEVERALEALAPGSRAAVAPVSAGGALHLRARIEPDPALPAPTPAALREGLRRRLPAWMVPAVVELGPLPRTPSGKVDLPRLIAAWTLDPGPAPTRRAGRPRPAAHPADPGDLLTRLVAALGPAIPREGLPLAALGIDSLGALRLSAALAAAGHDLSPEQLRAAPDLAALRARLRRPARAAGAPTDRWIARGRALAAALPPPARSASTADLDAPALLTGATGGLGARVLAARLTAGQPTLALVRAADPAHAKMRLHGAFSRYGLDPMLVDHPALEVLPGDLRGLRADGGGPLGRALRARPWASALHLAADLNLSAAARGLEGLHLRATAGLLALALHRGAPVLHASTLSVFVDTDRPPGLAREEQAAPAGARVFGGYAMTRLGAEALVEAADGLPRLIVRYGLLTGDRETGRAAPADWLSRVVRGLAALGAVPAGAEALCLDLSPADEAASATIGLHEALCRGQAPLRAHVAAPAPTPLAALLPAFAAAGRPLRAEAPAAFRARAAADPRAAAALLALARAAAPGARHLRALDLFQATGWTFSTAAATAALGRPPIGPADPALIARLIAAALEP